MSKFLILFIFMSLPMLNSKQSSASFYCLHQVNSLLLVSSYNVGHDQRLTPLTRAESIKLDLGKNETLHWELKGASISPGGHWLALLEDDHSLPSDSQKPQRQIIILDMTTHRQVWSKQDEGGWYYGTRSEVRWISSNSISVVREFYTHDPLKHSILRYAINTYTAPSWQQSQEKLGRMGADRWEVLLSNEAFRRRRGAAKLLNYLGFDTAMYPDSGSRNIQNDLDDKRGTISQDGKALVCVVSKIKQPWELSHADSYQNHFVLAWQTKSNSGRSGWRTKEFPYFLKDESFPFGIWLWKHWLIVHSENSHNKARLLCFRFEGSTKPIELNGEIFVPRD